MIVSTHSGGGKTTVTQGLLAWLMQQNYKVQSFKLGPDYIDSGHHQQMTGRPCINLDSFLLDSLEDEFQRYAKDMDVVLIESVGGLFDDFSRDNNSAAAIAKKLKIPIILVIDAFSACQTAGIMANALLEYDSELSITGVIFNRVSSSQHFGIASEVVKNQDWVLGSLPYCSELALQERHLGLITAQEKPGSYQQNFMANLIEERIDCKKLLSIQTEIEVSSEKQEIKKIQKSCILAVARDSAFSFYYHANLEMLKSYGAEIVYFSPLNDPFLPEGVNALYIGGGYPELYAKKLSENKTLLKQILNLAENNLPIYAECGGLIYLSEAVQNPDDKNYYPMLGVFPFQVDFSDKLALSYVRCRLLKDCLIGQKGDQMKGHVFHRTQIRQPFEPACEIENLADDSIGLEGYVYKNVFASYAHLHFNNCPRVAENIVNNAILYKENHA
ncbi:MAG: cobyrinate a,c-diamide synthase [Myxococcaceae bacterium]